MPEIADRILGYLRSFSDHMLEGDFEAAVEHHMLPMPVIRPFGTELFESHAEIARDLETFWQHWAQIGVRNIAPKIIGLRSFAHGVYLADIEWVFSDANGGELALVHTTYGFRQIGENLGISAIFGHDEVLQRPIVAKT